MNHNRRGWWLIIPLLVLVLVSTVQQSTTGITITEIVLLILIPVLGGWGIFMWRLNNKKLIVTLSTPVVWFLIFATWSILSVFPTVINGVDIITWGRRVFPPLTLIIVALVTSFAIRSQKQMSVVYNSLIVISIIIVVQSLLPIVSINLSDVSNLQQLREFGQAKFASVLTILTIPHMMNYKKSGSILYLTTSVIAVSIGLAGLFISFTRTIWVSTIIGIIFVSLIYIYQNRPNISNIFLICCVTFATGIVVLVTAPDQLRLFVIERLRSLPNALQSKSLQDRLFELRGLLDDILNNPVMILTGNGYGAEFTFYSVSPFSWEGVGWTSNAYSHNYYAYILWSTGVIGLSCFLGSWYIIFRDSVRKLVHSEIIGDRVYLLGCVGSLVVLFVSVLTVPFLTQLKWCVIFGTISGIIISIINRNRL